jgi:hypothetical protein
VVVHDVAGTVNGVAGSDNELAGTVNDVAQCKARPLPKSRGWNSVFQATARSPST